MVGLGLRDLAHCPVELNLMPRSSIQRQEFGQKKPYLVASVFSLALVVFAIYMAEVKTGVVVRRRLEEIKPALAQLTSVNQQLQTALADRDKLKSQADQMKGLADNRFYWVNVLTELRKVMIQAEASEKAALFTPENGGTNTDVGLWVESFTPDLPYGSPWAGGQQTTGSGPGGMRRPGMMRPGMMDRYSNPRQMQQQMQMPVPTGPAANEISALNLTCRAVNRQSLSPTANSDLAFMVRQDLTNSPCFKEAVLKDTLTADSNSTNTFTFSLTVKLTKPFKL